MHLFEKCHYLNKVPTVLFIKEFSINIFGPFNAFQAVA